MGKIKTVEVIVRGDIIEKNIIVKLGDRLRDSKLRADFNASIAVPPFLQASAKHYPSLAVLYGAVDLEDLFKFKALFEDFCSGEECEIISFKEL
jgi:hypothetical protein